LLGIRHHGPGSARSVIRALDDLSPATVLVELPADGAPLLAWIADERLEPPVALLASRVDDPARAAFWPLADFSPEWSAVRWALDHGVPVDPIDAPSSWVLSRASGGDRDAHRDPLAELAAAAGEPDAERWWEDVVEHRGDGLPAFAAVAAAMAALREGTSTAMLDAVREAHMRTAVRTAVLAAGSAGPVAVVCGAWHVPALDVHADTAPTASADRATLKSAGLTARPASKVLVTWVPWSDARLQRSTGYGAGVAHPGWYRHVFRHPGPDGVTRFFVDAADALRRRGLAASPDHLIAASRLADGLAALRSRPRAGLAEVLDAARAVMDGGAGSGVPIVGGVLDELTVGRSIGTVPPDAPQVPLARDVAAAQRAARLKPEDGARTLELDLRTPNGRRRSHLLHRTNVLGFGWAELDDGRGTRGTFRETWRLGWDPAIALRIVECAPLGTTLVAAATTALVEQAAAATRLADASALVHAALVADLRGAVAACADSLGRLSAAAPDLADLIDSLPPLAGALRYGDVRGSDSAALETVVDEIVVRVIAGLDTACRSLDDDAATAMVERMSALQGALATLDHAARHRDLPAVLARVADGRAVHGLVRGRATRLLHDGGAWTASEVSQRVGRALTPGTPAADAARFVEGFLAGSGTVLVHDHELLAVVDEWISSLGHDGFTDIVALLRRTFGAFEPAERRQLGVLVSSGTRAAPAALGSDLDAARVAAAMATVRSMLGLPAPDERGGES
jgi:hypothetical protein